MAVAALEGAAVVEPVAAGVAEAVAVVEAVTLAVGEGEADAVVDALGLCRPPTLP